MRVYVFLFSKYILEEKKRKLVVVVLFALLWIVQRKRKKKKVHTMFGCILLEVPVSFYYVKEKKKRGNTRPIEEKIFIVD